MTAPKTELRTVTVKLTRDEKEARTGELVSCLAMKKNLEQKKKDAAKAFQKDIDEVNEEIERLRVAVYSGSEDRQLRVRVLPVGNGTYQLVDPKSGEVYGTEGGGSQAELLHLDDEDDEPEAVDVGEGKGEDAPPPG